MAVISTATEAWSFLIKPLGIGHLQLPRSTGWESQNRRHVLQTSKPKRPRIAAAEEG